MKAKLARMGIPEYLRNHSDRASFEFHNMLLRDDQLSLRVRVLASLFAVPPPAGRGRYHHHDGYRS